MTFDPQGRLKVSVTAQTQAQATDLRDRIIAAGFQVEPSTFTAANGRIAGSFLVTIP
jgi:general secretion pathway protein L